MVLLFLLKNSLIYFAIVYQSGAILNSKGKGENSPNQEQVVVRAVFINCEPYGEIAAADNEATRFQREELFKHSALQSCRQKLGVTVKMTSEPDKSPGDEYIPIEHVFDGSNKKRTRLLNPYILRLRRESPVQAYKLQRVDTVTGIFSKSDYVWNKKPKENRIQRSLQHFWDIRDLSFVDAVRVDSSTTSDKGLHSVSTISTDKQFYKTNATIALDDVSATTPQNDAHNDVCTLQNNPVWRRERRHEHNIIVEDIVNDENNPYMMNEHFHAKPDLAASVEHGDSDRIQLSDNKRESLKSKFSSPDRKRVKSTDLSLINKVDESGLSFKYSKKSKKLNDYTSLGLQNIDRVPKLPKRSEEHIHFSNDPYYEKNLVIYEIAKPEYWDIWTTANVQLFEKMSTAEGKTVWNDVTKGYIASVSSNQPEWSGSDLYVRYKPIDWISKEEFSLPAERSWCLLAPYEEDPKLLDEDDDNIETSAANSDKFLIVPIDDIEGYDDKIKSEINYTEFSSDANLQSQELRKVVIRAARAVTNDGEEMQISSRGSDKFLTLPHRRPLQAQIDLEARADRNELIRVGSLGSIITIVADNSRRTRSVITVQAMNKGLAAARFRVKAHDCGPKVVQLNNAKVEGLVVGPVLIPPKHTQRFNLEVPVEIPTDASRCSVSLINDFDETVAEREVVIKKGDRCFCVWHCDCVCLDDDPKLLCRALPESRQVAAGLDLQERSKQMRALCYTDATALDVFVVFLGVPMMLLFLGLCKAVLGLPCRFIAVWGLERMVVLPRKMDRYYEAEFRDRSVVYDNDGWPVHPDTLKRTVRFASVPAEFVLNIIFFITVPCLILWEAIRRLGCKTICKYVNKQSAKDEKKFYSAPDMQAQRQRGRSDVSGIEVGVTHMWMTPPAEELSTDIWKTGLTDTLKMLPLLDRRGRMEEALSSCVDSEQEQQDDTEYVLMQIKKSKESLHRSQRKIIESSPSTVRNTLQDQFKKVGNQ